MILAESLKNDKPAGERPKRGVRSQPRVPKSVLEELARKHNSLDGSR